MPSYDVLVLSSYSNRITLIGILHHEKLSTFMKVSFIFSSFHRNTLLSTTPANVIYIHYDVIEIISFLTANGFLDVNNNRIYSTFDCLSEEVRKVLILRYKKRVCNILNDLCQIYDMYEICTYREIEDMCAKYVSPRENQFQLCYVWHSLV